LTATSTPATDELLVLSNDADLDRVDAVRADSDAILVGAATVRNDNTRLLVRAPSRRAERIATGLPPTPIKVTVTSRAQLDPCAAFFVTGDTEKLVYCPTDAVAEARCRLGAVATVVDGGRPIEMCRISEELRARGVRRLTVEGGGKVLTHSSRPALRTSCTWSWRLSSWATPGRGGSSAMEAFRGTQTAVRSRRRCTSSAMSYSCATRSRTVSTRSDAKHDACARGDDPYPGHAAAERVPTAVHLNAINARYLATKAGRGEHAGSPVR
jgi:hypothetical protein